MMLNFQRMKTMKSIKKSYKEAPITIHELNTDNEIKIINSYKK